MRLLSPSLIVLGLASLSCSGFGGWSVRSDAGPLAAEAGTPQSELEAEPIEGDHPRLGIDVEDFRPVASSALDDRVRADIRQELADRHTGLSDREISLLAHTIVEESERYGLDPTLTFAVIRVESGGYHLAVSPVGALGLMQLLPSTAEELARKHGLSWRGPNSLFDPILNVKLGTAYLSQLERKYGSMNTALAAYNWGPGRIDRRLRSGGSVPRIYREQVMKFYEAGARLSRSASRS
jgi:soluble lytic murein transglycosylase-like protein